MAQKGIAQLTEFSSFDFSTCAKAIEIPLGAMNFVIDFRCSNSFLILNNRNMLKRNTATK